jgi:Cu/Ag efflux protein CusF
VRKAAIDRPRYPRSPDPPLPLVLSQDIAITHTIVRLVPFVIALAASPAAVAQHGHDHGLPVPKATSTTTAPKAALAEGEVRKVDRAKGTVTLKHGPLAALGMGPMTMPFTATDPKLLANVKEGDKVRFVPAQGKDGALLVTKIDVVK